MIHTVCHECGGSGYTTWLRLSMSRGLTSGTLVGPAGQEIDLPPRFLGTRYGSCHENPRPCLFCQDGKLTGIVAPV